MKKETLQWIPQKFRGSWGYYEQQYMSKLNNLEVMEKFSESYNLLRLNQEEIENLNRPITSKEIESVT